MTAILKLDPGDDVGVATRALRAGETFDGLVIIENIPSGHKVATHALATGAIVRKYGQAIGKASASIAAGEHVHVHNLTASQSARAESRTSRGSEPEVAVSPASFHGFRRKGGAAGTRNYVGIVATVNCSATVVRKIVERFRKRC